MSPVYICASDVQHIGLGFTADVLLGTSQLQVSGVFIALFDNVHAGWDWAATFFSSIKRRETIDTRDRRRCTASHRPVYVRRSLFEIHCELEQNSERKKNSLPSPESLAQRRRRIYSAIEVRREERGEEDKVRTGCAYMRVS